MRVLVPLKPVPDPDLSAKIRVSDSGQSLLFPNQEIKPNPFDEYALEAALRLTEDGRNPRERLGETVIVTLGTDDADVILRAGLATGADRAIRVPARDEDLDASIVARVLAHLVNAERCDLVVMGKQSADGDGNEVGQRLAHVLGWPQVTFVSRITELADGRLDLDREIDGGVQKLRVRLPAVVTVDLRIVTPEAVRSRHTPKDFVYPPGVRFAPLPAIMRARKKPLELGSMSALLDSSAQRLLQHVRYEIPAARASGRIVSSTKELVRLLTSEAKVL